LTRLAPLLALCLIAGCDRPDRGGNDATAAGNAANAADAANAMIDNGAANATEAPRSILRPEVAEPEAPKQIEPAHLVIGFGSKGLELDDAARTALDTLMDDPAMKAGGPVTLRGHSDSRGHDGDNRVASRKRAEAVRAYLLEKGVAEKRISLIALGEDRPIAPNAKEDGSDNPEGRAKNRRVEIDVALPEVLVPPPVKPAAAPAGDSDKE